MRRILSLTALALSLSSGIAAADHGRAHAEVHVRGPAVRESVVVRGPAVRESVVVRGPTVHENVVVGGPVVRERVVVGGPAVRENVVVREPVVVRYRDYHVRPEVRVETFAPVVGYTWHRGDWVWNGYEWIWQPGWYVRVGL